MKNSYEVPKMNKNLKRQKKVVIVKELVNKRTEKVSENVPQKDNVAFGKGNVKIVFDMEVDPTDDEDVKKAQATRDK